MRALYSAFYIRAFIEGRWTEDVFAWFRIFAIFLTDIDPFIAYTAGWKAVSVGMGASACTRTRYEQCIDMDVGCSEGASRGRRAPEKILPTLH